ncbi:hypothetical protein [Streptomyces sp. NPDC059783]|uniref:hypothetical protein n=1 Tax=Streptomyces sp. NPDC059783 TaxID=3346944 RepID=UPI00366345ED
MGAWSGGELTPKDADGAGPPPSLAEVVGSAGGLPEDAVLWIAAGLAGALAVMHQAGRVHGDVRAGNVLLTRGGPRLTGDTPAQGGGTPLPAADMVALGMLLVAAYTGAGNQRPDLDHLPVRLRQVVAVCLVEDPEERATPARLLDVLRSLEPETPARTIQTGEPIAPADRPPGTAPPPDSPVEAPPPKPHGLSGARLALVIVAAALVGVVVTALLLLVPGRDSGTRTADAPATSRPTRLQPSVDDVPQPAPPPRQEPSEEQAPSADASTDPAPEPTAPTSQAPPAPTPQQTRQTGTINDCSGKPLTEPVSLLLFCGDGNATLHDLIWTDWGSDTATAQGVLSEVVCQPSCVDGREASSAATVVVSGLTGGRYTLMEIRAPQSPTDPDTYFTLDRIGPTYRG